MDTYFTFPDGGLRYDCATCRQRCCRGKGIALGGGELSPLLQLAPALAPYLRLRPGGTVGALNVTDGCWFLQPDGLCAIEAKGGRDRKPATCRLFPFNRVYSVGEVRVVDVNSVLCPIEDAGGAGVRHQDLLDEISALSGSPLLDVPAAQPPELSPDWLARERAVCALAQALQTDPDALCRESGDAQAAALVPAWARLYGVVEEERVLSETQIAPRVALLLPSLRWNRLFRRHTLPYGTLMGGLPRRVRALTLLAALSSRTLVGSSSLRGLSELWEGQAPLLDVFERWDEPVRLLAPRFDADIPPFLQPALGVMLGLAFRGGRSLGEVVEAAAAVLTPPQRPLALALAASQLSTLLPS